ncbi:23502_t:CDS:1, partial [Gigaspora margarita]
IAKWIIKLWIDKDILMLHNLALIENRAKNIQIPVDIGRIPYKIAMEEGFSRFI